MKIDGSGQRKTQRGLCSHAHGKWAVPIEFKLSRGKAFFWPVFGTATLPTSASGASPRDKRGFWPLFGTSTLPTDASVTSSRGEEGLLAGLWNDHHAHKYLRGILAEPL